MIHSIILGIVQGISEFLPISSSAHLVILPYLLNFSWQGLVFDVALHFGTLFAIIIFFWRDIVAIFRSAFKGNRLEVMGNRGDSRLQIVNNEPKSSNLSTSQPLNQYPPNLLWMLLLASIPGAIAGVLLEAKAETIFRSPLLIAAMLAIFGIVIWLVDKRSARSYKLSTINYRHALVIGLAQMLAIVPGVSRSGATMAAGRALGLKRSDSARFSFLLAAPIIFGSALFELRHLTYSMLNINLLVSFLFSLVFGLLTIKYLLKFLEKSGFGIFAVYRIILALIVIAVYLLR